MIVGKAMKVTIISFSFPLLNGPCVDKSYPYCLGNFSGHWRTLPKPLCCFLLKYLLTLSFLSSKSFLFLLSHWNLTSKFLTLISKDAHFSTRDDMVVVVSFCPIGTWESNLLRQQNNFNKKHSYLITWSPLISWTHFLAVVNNSTFRSLNPGVSLPFLTSWWKWQFLWLLWYFCTCASNSASCSAFCRQSCTNTPNPHCS